MPAENDSATEETKQNQETPSLMDVVDEVLAPPAEPADPDNPPLDKEPEPEGQDDGTQEETPETPSAEASADGEEPNEEEAGKKGGEEVAAGANPDGGSSEAKQDDSGDDENVDLSDEELNKADRKTFKKKLRSAVQQRGREKSRADGLQAQVDQLTQMLGVQDVQLLPQVIQENASLAQSTRQFNDFMQANNLQSQDVQKLLAAGAAITAGNWAQVKEIMGPYIEIMNAELGGDLPPDIRQDILNGKFDEETGKQIAKQRADHARSTISADRAQSQAAQAAAQIQQSNQAQAQGRQVAQQNEIVQSMDRWAAAQRQKDPDFKVKEGLISRILKARKADEGMPANAQVATQWAQEALAEANQLLAPAAKPASTKKPSAPAPTGSGKQGAPKPQSIADVVDLALKGSQAA